MQAVKNKIFRLSEGKWTIQQLSERETREAEYSKRKIAQLLVQGLPNKKIAEERGCTRSNVSQIKRKLVERGLISFDEDSGSYLFTEKGEDWIQVAVN